VNQFTEKENVYYFIKKTLPLSDTIITVPSINMIDNYMQIDSFKRGTGYGELVVKTIEGKEFTVSDKNEVYINESKFDIKCFTQLLKLSIDMCRRLNIYKIDNKIFQCAEDSNENMSFRDNVGIFNKILESTKNYYPANHKGQVTEKSLEKIIPYIQSVNAPFANTLMSIVNDKNKLTQFNSIYFLANQGLKGLVFSDVLIDFL
jgi:hypothetical protein